MSKEELMILEAEFNKDNHFILKADYDYAFGLFLKGAEVQRKVDDETFMRPGCNPISLIHYLDEHRPSGKMCFSNGECADLEAAFNSGDWAKVIRYIRKYNPTEE